jgi:hypothetical protein
MKNSSILTFKLLTNRKIFDINIFVQLNKIINETLDEFNKRNKYIIQQYSNYTLTQVNL